MSGSTPAFPQLNLFTGPRSLSQASSLRAIISCQIRKRLSRISAYSCKNVNRYPSPTSTKSAHFFFRDLATCSHVFLRNDAVKQPLEKPYTGPYKVVQKISDKVYALEVKGRTINVAVERLKPAHFIREDTDSPAVETPNQSQQLQLQPSTSQLPPHSELRTYVRTKKHVQFKL